MSHVVFCLICDCDCDVLFLLIGTSIFYVAYIARIYAEILFCYLLFYYIDPPGLVVVVTVVVVG